MAFGRKDKSEVTAEPVRLMRRATDRKSIKIVAGTQTDKRPSDEFFRLKDELRTSLIEILNPQSLQKLELHVARQEVTSLAREILTRKNDTISQKLRTEIVDSLTDDILGFGPLEPLLARDDITDIMVNGPNNIFIEVNGRVHSTNIQFKDNDHLTNICQRIVNMVGRRVDESNPICDARLLDGSRVNVILPPLSIDGATLTIRKFRKDKLKLSDLVHYGSVTTAGAELLRIIGKIRCNVLVSGGTGSGKTTLLNAITAMIDMGERVVTCEDAAELQLQQEHVVRLETRPPNLEGEGEISMRDLVKNCLRMRPDRIIVGEVRGGEAFDLLQAMNTGHDGSMGTIHANTPRDALSRLETMIVGAGYNLPTRNIREMIAGSIDVIIQTTRLRDGRRIIANITEITGMEEDTLTTQDLLRYDLQGEDREGNIIGRHLGMGVKKPSFQARAEYFSEQDNLFVALDAINAG